MNSSRRTIASAVGSDYSAMLEEMKDIEVMGTKVGDIKDIDSMTPGQLYDETYIRILKGTIKELQLRLEELS